MNSSLFPDFPKCQITRNIEIYVSRLQFKGHYRNNRSLLLEMGFFMYYVLHWETVLIFWLTAL